MSEKDMLSKADLVVDAKCVTIVCVGKPVDDGKKIITTYKSTLWPSKGYKGPLPKSFHINGEEWKWKGSPPVGGWKQGAVAKGWAGKLYLTKKPDGTYTKVWWNAMIPDKATSKPLPLPLCSGDAGPPPDMAKDMGAPDKSVDKGTPDKGKADKGKPDMGKPDKGKPDKGKPDKQKTDDVYIDMKPTPGADGGTSEPEDDSGCSVSGTGSAPTLLLGLLGLVWLRRRGRSSP